MVYQLLNCRSLKFFSVSKGCTETSTCHKGRSLSTESNDNIENRCRRFKCCNIKIIVQALVNKFAIAQVRIGELCGNNNGQHVYIHLPEDRASRVGWKTQISFEFGGMQQYRYNIMVTQVMKRYWNTLNVWRYFILISFKLDEARSSDRPLIDLRSGAGCHQFYSESTGRITSFNFDRAAPQDSRYQRGLRYNMCVKPFGRPRCEVTLSAHQEEDLVYLLYILELRGAIAPEF